MLLSFTASRGPVNDQEYLELFPTFYLMHTVGEDHSFGLDYSRRIVRPRFQSLNPYQYFLNQNNYNVGNPNLQPSISNKINFNYTYKNKLSFDLYWDRADGAMARLPFQDNENRILRSATANMIYDQQYSLDVMFFDYIQDWWYLYALSSFFFMENQFIAQESGNIAVKKDVLSTFLLAQNYFTISEDRTLTAELTGTFLPNILEGSYEFDEPQTVISAGLRKSFLDNRLVFTLNVDDIFN
ncbi:outer membrane beta-barrel family protein [Antarcticibacterium sp. 1MA-6-2]|uniref:outer membrane beta-barrel family protein n=1 Tax=Antarcticibacterium sp. 1MA-6-2 TaxID=2908210 RepID=UPI0021073333|nr:outer membrane beta-barrel family protein [Antarcticibacterium sp. 1MA-6-2]